MPQTKTVMVITAMDQRIEAGERPAVDSSDDSLANQLVDLLRLNAQLWDAFLRRHKQVVPRLQCQTKVNIIRWVSYIRTGKLWLNGIGFGFFLKYVEMKQRLTRRLYTFIICLRIIIPDITKRAQFPYSSWLAAAIAALAPVTLARSSTLVTAGIFIIYRFNNIIKDEIILKKDYSY